MLTHFWAKRFFRLFAWWFELVPAVPNLRKKVISKSWSGLRWQEETRQGKKRDKNAEADDKKVELVSYGQWGCPSLLTLSTNVKLLKPWKQVYWVSIHASVSFLKHQSLNLSKMQYLRWDNWKCFVLLIFLSAFAPSPRQTHFIHLSNMFFSVTIQIKIFALFTMSCSKYPSNVIEATVWCRTTFEISLLSYYTYQINALWVYPLRISQFWSKPHEAVWDRWKTAQRFRGKYFRPIFVKNVVVMGEKHDAYD